ncbi:MAG TPA: hypothetical protein VKG43_12695 [Acidimicrobiales bacterium]|nr:hypothetical protein [Acidimicrobiales bacterium]
MTGPDRPAAPSEDEALALIAAAAEALLSPVAGSRAPAGGSGAWRFSGRWWMKPVALRRDRPWSWGG